MDFNEAKYEAFYDELEKMGGWPAIAAVASRALPAILSVGSKLVKGIGGKAGTALTAGSMLAGGAKRKAPGMVGGFMQRQKPFFKPRFMG